MKRQRTTMDAEIRFVYHCGNCYETFTDPEECKRHIMSRHVLDVIVKVEDI